MNGATVRKLWQQVTGRHYVVDYTHPDDPRWTIQRVDYGGRHDPAWARWYVFGPDDTYRSGGHSSLALAIEWLEYDRRIGDNMRPIPRESRNGSTRKGESSR